MSSDRTEFDKMRDEIKYLRARRARSNDAKTKARLDERIRTLRIRVAREEGERERGQAEDD